MKETLAFLDRVWGERRSYVDLPSKVNGHWIPFNVRWPDDRELVARRIASCLEDDEDLYFSVAQFGSRGRRMADTLPSRWLWADLDRTDPVFLGEDGLQPTIAWESSPGRFQCLWRLDRSLPPETLGKLNRALTYAVGADKTGWDLTQVLRPPGSKNHKYSPIADVELLWDSTKVYKPATVIKAVRRASSSTGSTAPRVELHSGSTEQASAPPRKMPARARALLRTPKEMVVTGERSGRLWELERLLADAGYDEDAIFDLVWPCAWNKHAEVSSGERRLRQEIAKAIARRPAPATRTRRQTVGNKVVEHRAEPPADTGESEEGDGRRRRHTSPFVDYATFLGTNIESPRWLVEDIWSAASHGIIGGEPKTTKSTMAMALALSVASGRPFLNQFEVATTGPVLVIQEENAPWMVQDRLRKLAWWYGLISKKDIEVLDAPRGSLGEHIVRLDFPAEAPFKLLNNYGFDLTDEEDRDMLEQEMQSQGTKLLVLDPFYLVSGGVDLNRSHEVMPLMQWLMALRYNYDCAVVVVHHWHKANDSSASRRPGQRLMGSGLLHGWIESALYFEALEPSGNTVNVRMEREFRNVAPRSALEMAVQLGETGDLDMAVTISRYDVSGETIAAVTGSPGITLSALAELLGVDKRTARSRAVGAGCVMEKYKHGTGIGWRAFPPGHEVAVA